MFKGIVSLLGGIVGLAQSFFTAKEREKDRESGRNEVKVGMHERASDAQKAMEDVARPDDDSTDSDLRKGEF